MGFLEKATAKELALFIGLLGIAAMFLIPSSFILRLTIGFFVLIYPIYFVLSIVGLLKNNKSRWIISCIPFFLCLVIWGYSFFYPKKEKPNETVTPTIQLNLQPVILPQQIESGIELIEVNGNQEKSELTATLRNNNPFALSPDVNVWLGIFHTGNIPADNRIEWVKSDDKYAIKSGRTGKFSFHVPVKQSMHVVALVEDKELRKEITLDEMGVQYTWDYWRSHAWASWQKNRNLVAESPRMQDLLDSFKGCLDEHSIGRDYEACLEQKK